MAREEILENLNKTLKKPVEKEMVVYIMVEIRKFIERSNSASKEWKELKYWCDWVVHTYLDRIFAKETLKEMEKYIISNPDSKFHHSYFNEQFISLEKLRQNLHKFLEQNNLPSEIVNIPPWDTFSKCLVETLQDCPLEKNSGLVRKFFFSKRDHIPEAERMSIDWELIFDESRNNLYGSVLRFENHEK